jgi:hypothetical protein
MKLMEFKEVVEKFTNGEARVFVTTNSEGSYGIRTIPPINLVDITEDVFGICYLNKLHRFRDSEIGVLTNPSSEHPGMFAASIMKFDDFIYIIITARITTYNILPGDLSDMRDYAIYNVPVTADHAIDHMRSYLKKEED